MQDVAASIGAAAIIFALFFSIAFVLILIKVAEFKIRQVVTFVCVLGFFIWGASKVFLVLIYMPEPKGMTEQISQR